MNKKIIIEQIISQNKLDAVLFYSFENRFWYSDFISTLGYLLITSKEAKLLVDGRYITEAKTTAKNVTVENFTNIFQSLSDICQKEQIINVGFEADYITYGQLQDWKQMLPKINFVPLNVRELRMIKDQEEIKRIQKACEIGDLAYQDILKNVKSGMTERELEAIILNSFSKNGATKASFETIVASGLRSSMPHGKASDKVINDNEIITCDFGCVFQGFCSDMTRTFALGTIDPKLIEIHNIVREAQMNGIKAVKPGIKIGEIDKICRDYITEKGYGEYFSHGTGHGLGIEIHEAPWVTKNEQTILKPGMVITVEPGIYIPELGGVRIEDDILVTENSYQILTQSPREIDILKR
ncbi:M24 family metallopeptidase [Spiroplasma platyhelix]|uniref:Aminopeptidase P family protein n=1 Tax=Spiroplasma platyhelix PALS-1 TaxID=1276218 RepID=A0A846TW76_9MOLU|nr:aminopeptidase P family protein [Spiroplasma platyhelix]MBE4703868.1 Aminopeptidase YpdF [Spiroplasma platyhelix PALS-1]NKE38241.1 aminopeptidase P family protein [Spiroplasma platyhelix PALS-1]UJB29126.1 Xaa-Pro dipeptidase [Spiroplasma platyhelix PALS-1]